MKNYSMFDEIMACSWKCSSSDSVCFCGCWVWATELSQSPLLFCICIRYWIQKGTINFKGLQLWTI